MESPIMYAYSYVRISSDQQRKGDGPRRQLDTTRRWCEENGYHLDESLRLEDLGVSAFKGSHRGPKAALAGFLTAVQEGKIPTGSVLVVENLDRLSREDIDEALELFLGLIRSGVNIRTHDPDRLYTRADLKANPYSIIEPLVIFARANDESRIKSYRGVHRWEQYRRLARTGEMKATKTAPAWLKLAEDRKTFTLKTDAVEVVRRIFALASEGQGCPAIARMLNTEGVPAIGAKGHWNHAYVHNLLTGRTVLGEYQPCRKVEGKKRVSVGEPIAGYYPPIIDEATWLRAQAALLNRKRVRGRPTPLINLFVSLIYDGHDDQPMHVHKRDGVSTLVSSGALSGRVGSKWRGYRYDHFERAFLRFVTDLKPEHVLPASAAAPDEAGEIAGQLQVLSHKIAVIQGKIDKETDIDSLVEILVRLEGQRTELKERLEEIKRRRVTGEVEMLGEAKSVVALLEEADEEERPALRTRLQGRMRSLVKRINVLVGDKEGARVCAVEVIFHDNTTRWFHAGYSVTRKKMDFYEFGTPRLPAEEFIFTMTPQTSA